MLRNTGKGEICYCDLCGEVSLRSRDCHGDFYARVEEIERIGKGRHVCEACANESFLPRRYRKGGFDYLDYHSRRDEELRKVKENEDESDIYH